MNKQPKARETEVRTLATTQFRMATLADGSRTLSGLIPYNSLSADLGGWKEMIAPSAFAGALEPNADVLMLRDHDVSLLMGRTKSKTLLLVDAPDGLHFTDTLPKTTQAADLAESVQRGDLDANSFGFFTLEDKWVADEAGNVVRTLISVELLEISPCSFPAYPASQVSVRSCPTEIRSLIETRKMKPGTKPGTKPGMTTMANAAGCECDCPECVSGDCQDCSDPACTDPNCQAERSLRNTDANRRLAIRVGFLTF